jgi:hypothetical protein
MICPSVDFMSPFSLFQALEVNFKTSKQQENAKQKTTKQLEKRKKRRKMTREVGCRKRIRRYIRRETRE